MPSFKYMPNSVKNQVSHRLPLIKDSTLQINVRTSKPKCAEAGVAVNAYDPSTEKVGTGGSVVQATEGVQASLCYMRPFLKLIN